MSTSNPFSLYPPGTNTVPSRYRPRNPTINLPTPHGPDVPQTQRSGPYRDSDVRYSHELPRAAMAPAQAQQKRPSLPQRYRQRPQSHVHPRFQDRSYPAHSYAPNGPSHLPRSQHHAHLIQTYAEDNPIPGYSHPYPHPYPHRSGPNRNPLYAYPNPVADMHAYLNHDHNTAASTYNQVLLEPDRTPKIVQVKGQVRFLLPSECNGGA